MLKNTLSLALLPAITLFAASNVFAEGSFGLALDMTTDETPEAILSGSVYDNDGGTYDLETTIDNNKRLLSPLEIGFLDFRGNNLAPGTVCRAAFNSGNDFNLANDADASDKIRYTLTTEVAKSNSSTVRKTYTTNSNAFEVATSTADPTTGLNTCFVNHQGLLINSTVDLTNKNGQYSDTVEYILTFE